VASCNLGALHYGYSHTSSMSILVPVPILSYLHHSPLENVACVNDILRAVVIDLRLKNQSITLSQASLLSLVSGCQKYVFQLIIYCPQVIPVPLEPYDTLHQRVVGSAKGEGSTGARPQGDVPRDWSDPDNVHVPTTCNTQLPYCQCCKLRIIWD